MKRRTGNKKVARAIALALASVVAVTSVPTSITAEETVLIQVNEQTTQETTPQVTVESITQAANDRATEANDYTGTFSVDAENVATGSGTIGGKTQDAYNDITGIWNAQDNFDTKQQNLLDISNQAETVVDKLTKDVKDGDWGAEGIGQIRHSEKLEEDTEKAMGVTTSVDANGQVVVDTTTSLAPNTDSLDTKVSNANTKISEAEKAKTGADTALAGVEQELGTANTKIGEANKLKTTADTDTTNAQTQIDTKNSIDTATQQKLDNIQTALENAVNNQKDALDTAVGDAVQAASNAAQVAGEKLTDAQNALKDATDAANEAEAHSADYNRQQMVNVVGKARQAANGAKQAADLADQAVTVAKQKETEAQNKVNTAKDAVKTAQDDAVAVLKDYKSQINAINALIDTANGSRSKAKQAMIAANTAIDDVLKMMEDDNDITVDNARDKVEAMRKAVEAANNAISIVTGLIDGTSNTEYGAAVQRLGWTQTRLTNLQDDVNRKNLAGDFKKAKEDYDTALEASQEATANKKKADDAVAEIDKLINGIANKYISFYDKWAGEADTDINDLKALLASGKTYNELKAAVEKTGTDYNTQKGILEQNNENLTADQVVGKYNKAVSDQPGLQATFEDLDGQVKAKQGIVSDCYRDEGGLVDKLGTAQSNLINTITDIREKYEFDDDTQEIKKDAEGNLVYSQAYKQLLLDSQETTEGTSEYKNGGKVLDQKDADYKAEDGKAIYKKTGYGQQKIIEGSNPRVSNDDIKSEEKDPISKDGDKLVETIKYTYEVDLVNKRNNHIKYSANDGGNFGLGWDETIGNNDDEITKNILKAYISQNTKFHLGITYNDLNDSNFNVDPDNKTVTVTLPGSSDPNDNSKNIYTYTYEETHKNFRWNRGLNQYIVEFSVKINETTAVRSGSFTLQTKYDYEKYDLVTTPGEPTQKAKEADKKINEIDGKADAAKDNLSARKQEKEDANTDLTDLRNKRANAQAALDGDPTKNIKGLLEQRTEAETAKNTNQGFIDIWEDKVTAYNTASTSKTEVDNAWSIVNAEEFNINNIENLSDADKDKYTNAINKKQQILDAKTRAQGYLAEAKAAQGNLDKSVNTENDAIKAYNRVNTKIQGAQARLDTVRAKLDALKTVQQEAVNNLGKTSVDKKIKLTDGTEVDLEALNTRLNNELKALVKFKPEDYNPLDRLSSDKFGLLVEIETEDEEGKKITYESLSKKLETALEIAIGILGDEEENLSVATADREAAEKDLKKAQENAKKAQDEADRAARALANWSDPSAGSSGYTVPAGSEFMGDYYIPEGYSASSGDDGSSSSSSSSSSLPAAGFSVTSGAGTGLALLPGITETSGVAGARTSGTSGRGSGRAGQGVAGVRTDDAGSTIPEKKNIIAKNEPGETETKVKAKENDVDKKLVKLDDNKVPLDAAPNNGDNLYMLFLLLAAGIIAFFTVYTYNRHKKKAALAEEMKKYKN